MNLFKLATPSKQEKLKIKACDENFKEKSGEEFVAIFNPSTFSLGFTNKFEETTVNPAMKVQQFKSVESPSLSIEMLLDFSGASSDVPTKYTSIYEAVEAFKTTCYDVKSEKHEPNYLKVIYGTLVYKCRLETFTVTLTLFRPDGLAIRGKINASFKQFQSPQMKEGELKLNSPDVTHKRVIGNDSNLTATCYNIYNRNDLYQEVAKANDLNTFRGLKAGTKIYFPPISKDN